MIKKISFLLAGFALAASTAYASDNQYFEDFESYNCSAVYNSEDLTLSYPGYPDSSLTSSNRFIINGKGGIYSDDTAYTANAAENIYCYAKTGDGTATLVFGGLDNGWHGAFSHPSTEMNSLGGAGGELNEWNRRLAVVPVSGNQVLQLNPTNSEYVNTYCIYANDNIEFYDHTQWSTDVYIDSMYSGGYFDIVLSSGEMSKIQPFVYLPSTANGRSEILDFIKFNDDGTISCMGEQVSEYKKKTWYTVGISIDKNDESTQFNFKLIDKSSGECVYESGNTDLSFSLDGEAVGIGYTAYTLKGSSISNIHIDNIAFNKVEFYAVNTSTRDISINGKGNVAIKFNSEYDSDTINNDTIKVFLKDEEIPAEISLLSQNRVKVSLPVLKPSQEYKIVVDGVQGLNGISAKCEIPFKTVSSAAVNSASIDGKNVSVTVKNNSTEQLDATVVAVCEDKNGVAKKVTYMPIVFTGEGQQTQEFTDIINDDTDNVYVYIISGFSRGIQPISDFKVLIK